MADVFLEANRQSAIVSSFMQQDVSDLSYYIPGNYGSVSRSLTQLNPSPAGATSTPAGKEVNFALPQWAITTDMLFEHQLTNGGNGSAYITGHTSYYTSVTPAGLGVFSLIELRARGQVICSNTDNYIRARVDSEQTELSLACKRVSRLFSTDKVALATAWSSSVVHTYTPCFFYMLEDIHAHWDSWFVEPLTVRCVYNTTAGNGYLSAVTSATSYLWLRQYNLEQSLMDQLRAKNFDKSRPFVQLGYSTFDDTGLITDSTTSTDITLRCQNAITRMFVFLKDRTYADYAKIQSITLTVNGRVIYSAVPHQVQNFEKYKRGSGSTLFLTQNTANITNASASSPFCVFYDNGPICINFGLQNDRTYNSGCVSFKGLNNPILTITYASATNLEYHVVSEYFITTSINTNNGNVSTTAAY